MAKRLTKEQRKERDIALLREKLVLIAQGAYGGAHPDDIENELCIAENLSRYLLGIERHILSSFSTNDWRSKISLWEFSTFADFDDGAKELYSRGVRP